MATSEQFMERWKSLTHPRTTANERAGNYTVLTSYLKESGVDPSFTKELCRHQQSLLKRIMTDITCKSCDHAALQVLGYCLHNIEFASKFNKDQANTTIKGLCDVILSRTTEKSVCTRALWCLTNQQLSVDYLINHVTSIVSMATEVITVHHVGVATVNSEALNLLIRFGEQFPPLFAKLVTTWYKAVVELITCKVHKVQQKALSLAVRYESHLHGNHDITHWLTKALKERVVSVMLSQLTEKGLDHTHLLKSWAHFVTVLGKTLHKHGSFLNELLRIVETGFKHRSPSVQVAAYDAWRILIINFSLDLTVMVSQKRLKLLLMPLLASAVRERHETVEQARIRTWWHLIGCLGQHKASQFQNVCVPFLMLCLGLDPKSDISQLAETISGLHSHSTKSDSNSTSSAPQTPKSTGTIHLAVTPTPSASSAQSSAATPTSSIGPGRLLSTVNTPRSRRGVEIEKGKKGSDRYQTPPNIAMVMTGCHALLKFTGCRDKVPQSLIESEIGQCVVFPKSIVPMETANFMLLFLDSLLTYSTQLYFKEKGVNLDKIIYHILSVIICSVEAEDGLSSTIPSSAALLVTPLVDLLTSGSLNEHVGRETTIKLLSHLIGLPPRLLTSSRSLTSDSWRKLSLELLKATKADQTSDWFTTNWHKLTDMIASSSQPLTNFLFLSNELNRLIKEGDMDRDTCSKLWTSLAKKLTSFISQTSQVNNGTSLDPSFETIRHVLKFPFLNLLDHGERSPVTHVMELWKNLYEMANVHMGLVVKETNLCTEIVCSDLYAAYGQYMKLESGSIEQKHQVLRFDLYQNAVASALSYIVSKIKWATLDQPLTSRPLTSGSRKERVKSMETLLSLLAWQLAVFWDTAKKGPLLLSQLTTPYTLLDLVESLYHHISTSSLLTMATEMIGQPLATLFEAILSSSVALSNSHRCSKLTQHDLELRVEKVWKAITICFQARHAHPYNSALLSTLSPLLVATLNSSSQQLCTLSLSFWAVTFDKSQKLDYPARLRDYFMKYLKDIKQPSELKLPGLRGNHKMLTSAQKDLVDDTAPITQSEVIQFSETQSHSQIQNQDPDVTTDAVVLPNPSPRKGVCGSFLNRKAPSSPYKPRPTPSSPQAKQLDEILARATTSVEKVQSSPLRVMGVAGGNKEGSPLASARRRLDLGNDKEDYVAVGPPQKKRRLLTEHQKEVMKERKSDLPTLYNALDPALDSAPMSIPTQDVQLKEDAPVISESKNQQSTSSRPEPPVSIPNSIPDSHSTTGSKTASPTSRDTPITIPDSPPLTPTSTSTQPPVSMVTSVTSATVRTSVNPSPVTLPTNTTVPELHPLASPPATHVPQYFHLPLPPGQVMPRPPTGPLSPPPLPPTAYPTLPLPHPHTTVSIPSAFPTSHITMTTGSAFNPPPHHVLATNPFHRSHGIPVIITQPGHGSMIQYIPTNKAGMVHSGPAPTAVAPPTMVPPLVVSQPTAPQLVSQGVQSVLSPESRPHLPHAVNIGGVLVTSRGPPTLPTYCEALSLKAMEEAFSQSSREASEQRRKRPQRTMATREKTTREERGKTQRQLPNEASKGDAPINQGNATVEGHSKASVSIQTSSNQPLTSTSAVPIPVSSTATATPTSPSVSTSSNSSSLPPSSKSSARTEEKSRESALQGFTSEKEVPLSDKFGSDGAVSDEEGAGKKMEDDLSPELMEVGGAFSSDDDVIEESEDPLSGVRKKKVRKNDKEGEKEQGGEREGVLRQSCGQTEIKVQPEQKDGQVERESHELNKSEVKGTSESDTVRTSDSKPDEVQPNLTNSNKVATNDQTTSCSNVSSGGRKSLSLRRHSSSSTVGDAGIGGGGEKEEVGGARKASLVDTPTNGKGGILKHTSQFDTPSTAKAGRRVQFAAKNVFHEPDSQKQKQSGEEEEEHKTVTPKHSRGLRTPQGPFSSRRTLLMSQTPPKMILVNKPHPPATPTQNSGPVYPSLKDCQSPVEQILPALSPSSKFTHGLLQLVSAQNITTVGSISSLSEQEVQTLPIKSPKVLTLRGALRSFEQQLQGSKRKSSFDGESGLATPPPRKQARLDFDLSSSTTTTTKDAVGVSDGKACEVSAESADDKKTKEQEQGEDKGKEETVRGEREEERKGEKEREGGEGERKEGEGENTSAALASQLTEEEHYTESEELSEVSHDLGGPIMTLCTPESQLTPPGDHAGDADDTSDGDIGDVGEGPTAKCAGEERKGMLESEAKDDEEEMDVEENKNSAVETVLPDSPPESPPTATPLAQAPPTATSSTSTQNSSVSHDHTYCSQTVETDATPNQSRSKKGEKIGMKERERRVGEPGSSMLSMMVHDHTYCSQRKEVSRSNSAHPTASSRDSKEKERGGEGERESRSKLSLMVHDHTYCSRQRRDPCLEETVSPALQDGGEERQTAIKRGERETREDATAEGSGVTEETDTSEATRDDTGMEIGKVDESEGIEFNTSMDSDILAEGGSTSSQSQELFSQDTSQVQDNGTNAPPTTTPTAPPTSEPCRVSHGEEEEQTVAEGREGIAVAKGNDINSADSAKIVESGHVEEIKDKEKDEGEEEGGETKSKEERPMAETKCLVPSHSVSTGSNGSSSSSTFSNIAECSQRPSSLDHAPLPATDSSSSSDQESSETSKFLDALSQLKDLSEQVNVMMDQKASLSRKELIAFQKTAGPVATSAQKFFQALMQHFT